MLNKRNQRENYQEEPYGESPEMAADDLYQRPGEGETRPRAAARGESVVDAHSTFDGRYETEHDLRIEGTVSGELVCRGLLTVERDASVKAKIEAQDAHIRGRIEGEIVCSGRLELASTAIASGTLRAGTLVVQEGASVNGTVETLQARPESRPTAIPKAITREPAPEPEPDAPAVTITAASPAAATDDALSPRPSRVRAVPSFAMSPSEPPRNSNRDR
jgi:cytoskeletal protein CcmA (bactofilin family)